MTGLYMNNLGALSAVTTLAQGDAADAIWNSFSLIERAIGGLNSDDYQKLRLFVNNAYADGYVVQQYDSPSQIQKPSPDQINAEVQRLNHGVYSDAELAKAADNVSRIMDKGFVFAKISAVPSVVAGANLADSSTSAPSSGSIGDILKAAAGAFVGFSPLLNTGNQAYLTKAQQTLAIMKQKNANAPQPFQRTTNYTPWILGLGGAALLGIVIIGVLKRKK